MPYSEPAKCDVCGQRHGWIHQRRNRNTCRSYLVVVERRASTKGTQRKAGYMKWFNYSEFDSPDEPGSGHYMDQEFLDMLDEARSRAGIPFVITSGYRT